jgi:hypothetical protein
MNIKATWKFLSKEKALMQMNIDNERKGLNIAINNRISTASSNHAICLCGRR